MASARAFRSMRWFWRNNRKHKNMKIEMDDNSSLAMTVCVIVLVIGLAALGDCRICEETRRQAIKAGLVQKPTANTQGVHWEKP